MLMLYNKIISETSSLYIRHFLEILQLAVVYHYSIEFYIINEYFRYYWLIKGVNSYKEGHISTQK